MATLRNRQKSIPHGYEWYDAALKFNPPRNHSFSAMVQTAIARRLANPGITKSRNLSVDPESVAQELDFFNAERCKMNGWTDYYVEAGGGQPAPAPFPGQNRPQAAFPSRQGPLANVVAGSEVLLEWIASGAEAVPQAQAEQRASVCVKCPLNGRGDWSRWFTVPVSNAIRAALRHRSEFKLTTCHDANLGVCDACSCPMGLKVWVPLAKFYPKMADESKAALHPACWIRAEAK